MKSEKRLTFDERRDISPRFSHDSRAVLFSSNRGGTFDIFHKSIDAGSAEALVAGPGRQDWPISSPDGTWFVRAGRLRFGDVCSITRIASASKFV